MKKRRLLFTHAYRMPLDPKQDQWNKPYPPLMTLQAAALIREAGNEVDLYDVMFEPDPHGIESKIREFRPDILVIFDDGFNYLTKMCLTNMRNAAFEVAALAGEQGCSVVACSSDATDHYRQYLDQGVDFVLLGEGEQTLRELVETLEHNRPPQNVDGLAFLEKGELVRTRPRQVMQDLDQLPLPAWDLLNLTEYEKRWRKHWGYLSLNIATTRGCPFKCNWCAKPIYGDSYKMRSTDHVIREIKQLQALFQFEHLWFCDDIFGLKRSWVIEFAEKVRAEGLVFRYKIQSRADLLVKPNYVEALAASGCEEAWMGVESGSQRILDAMDKGITIEQAREATHLLKAHGIRPCFFIQFGYLDETADDIRQTIDLINELLPYDIGISVSYPLPGTGFYEKVKQDLAHKANWTDSHDLDLMFKNTFPPEFYRKLHTYVHHNFRKHRAKAQFRNLFSDPGRLERPVLKRLLSYFYYTPATLLSKYQLKSIHHEATSRL